jgi:hypothetical protein
MKNMNEIYHKKIADQLLANQIKMIRSIPSPDIFQNELQSLHDLHDDILYGGARASAYVQPGCNVQSFDPATLSVGQNANEYIEGGSIKRKRGRPRKEVAGNIYDTMGEVAKTVAPLALRYGLPMLLGLGIDEQKKARGRPRKIQQVQPVISSQQIVRDLPKGSGLRKPKKQELITAILDMQETKPAKVNRTRKVTGAGSSGGNFLDTLKSVGNYVKPLAEKIGKDVILPVAMDVGKQALKSYLTGSGAGLKMKRRAELVKKIMKESGCSLPEASKFIKQNNLKY